MRTKANQALLLLSILLAVSVRSAIQDVAQNPICPAPGALTLDVEALQNTVEFQHSSFLWDSSTDDSVGVFVRKEDQEPYRMIGFTSDVQRYGFDCVGTQEMDFVALIRQILVLYDPDDSKYYACPFAGSLLSFSLNIVQLALPAPARIASPNRFRPFYYNDNDDALIVAVGSDTQTTIQIYEFPPTIAAMAPPITPTSFATMIAGPLDNFVGTNYFIFNKATNSVFYYDGTNWAGPIADAITAGFNWEVVTISENSVIIMEMTDGMENGKIIYTEDYNIARIDDATLPDQPTSYVYQTDGISNFIIYAGDVFYWFNLDINGDPRSEFLTLGEITTPTIDSIALSGNKLTILYAGEISYFRIVGQLLYSDDPTGAQIEHIMTKTFTDSIEADGTYVFGLECLCKGVRKFACYSSTLNCLIIKKADVECGTEDIPEPEED